MDTKNSFRKSLLSSAILAATLQSLSGTASAGTCPPPNASDNVHVSSGEFCEGGITVEPGGPIVNDIGLEGFVVGDVVNNDGMSDFWMNAGTLDGSFINNGTAQDVYIANGSEIFADIRNNGDMRYITVNDGPGTPTVVHGSIVNTGGVLRVHINGDGARVGGDIVNEVGAFIDNGIDIHDGASVAGNLINDGNASDVVVDGASSVAGNLENNGSAFGVGLFNGSSVAGDFVNSGDNFYFVAGDGSSVGGSVMNTGNSVHVGLHDGVAVTGDFGNEGYIDDVMIVDNSTVTGDVYTSEDSFTSGLQITDGASVGNVTNSGDAGFVVTARSQVNGNLTNDGSTDHLGIYDSQIAGDVINNGDTGFLLAMGDGTTIDGDVINTGYSHDGVALVDGVTVAGDVTNDGLLDGAIQVVNGSSVGGDLTNNGDVFIGPDNWNFIPDGAGPMAEDHTLAAISIDAGSSVTGDVVNNGNLIINFPPPPPPLPDGTGPIPDGMGIEHSLAGISVDHGSSVDDIINTGTIEVTAGLEHDGPEFADGIHANGIQVINGSTSGSIINDGAILADTFGIYVDGSGNDGVTVEGSVVNAFDGSIITQDNGIYIRNAEVTDSVVNEGVINSGNDNAIDIENSVIGGSVVNLGSLVSNEDYDAIDIDDTNIGGDVLNFGDITGEDGLDIDDSMVSGSVANVGVITADDEGFDIDQSDFGGDVVNAGLITAGGVGITIEGEENTLPPIADGGAPVTEIDYVSIGGNFINVGEIVAGEHGIQMEYVDIVGDFDSSGSIEAGPQGALPDGSDYFHGIELDDVKIGGNMIFGDISASGYGVNIDDTVIGGDVIGHGAITSIQEDAINLDSVEIGGSLQISGDLTAAYDGIDLSDVTIGGELNNSGDITAENGSGILLDYNVTVGEGFTNSGDIAASDYGISLVGDRWLDDGQIVTDGLVSVGGDFVNSGDITSGNHGIHIKDAVIDGTFTNTGDIATANNRNAINIERHTQINGAIVNTGDLSGNHGIRLNGSADLDDGVLVEGSVVTVAGGLTNTGDINSRNASIHIRGTDLGGDLVNTGNTFNTNGNAIDIQDSIIRGNIVNTGDIESQGSEGIDLDYVHVTGSILNTGTIFADSDPIIIDESHIGGSIINDGVIIARRNDGMELDDSFIGGSVINNGTIRAGDNAFEINGSSSDPVIIAGNLENHGEIIAKKGDGVTSNGDDGHDIDDLVLHGSVINTGSIVVKSDAYDVNRMSVGGDWINTGTITAGKDAFDLNRVSIDGDLLNSGTIDAGRFGFELDNLTIGGDWINTGDITVGRDAYDVHGKRVWVPEQEGPDGVTPGYHTLEPITVGGKFVNAGDIEAGLNGIEFDTVSIGTNGILEDGQANFENHGSILAKNGSAMDLQVLNVAGDLINTGNLDALKAPDYKEGNVLRTPGTPLPDGQVVISALGEDRENNAWFNVTNESGNPQEVTLTDEMGNFSKRIHLNPGEQARVNVGDAAAGANYTLTQTSGGNPVPDGMVVVSPVTLDAFSPPHKIDDGNSYYRGISLTGKLYDEGSEHEELVRSSVGGNLKNTGNISAVDQGIYIRDTDIGGSVETSGDITSQRATGIDIAAATIGGSFINSGDIDTTHPSQEGDYYRNDEWNGATSVDGELVVHGTGRDQEGNAWFVVRNETDSQQNVMLQEQSGDFSTQGFSVAPGEEVYINAGQIEGDLDLNVAGDGMTVVDTAGTNDRWFTPQTAPQHGISLVDVTVANDFINHGNITSNHNGIQLDNVPVGGDVINTGEIFAADGSAFLIGNSTIEGNIENHGLLAVTDYETGDGLSVHNSTVRGNLINNGQIAAHGTEGVAFDGSTLEGSFLNTVDGVIEAQSDALYFTDSEIQGDFINDGVIVAFEHDGIDLSNTNVGGSVINNGDITVGDNAIEIDGERDNYAVIGGSLINTGTLTAKMSMSRRSTGDDGFDLDDLHIQGDLLNTGDIFASDYGFEIDDIIIGGNFQTSGNIVAGDTGIEVQGSRFRWADDGAELVTPENRYVEIGGNFINTGDITAGDYGIDMELVAIGTNGMTDDGAANFENHGAITVGKDNGINLEASTVAGDFINTGAITASGENRYQERDRYYKEHDNASPDGEVVLTPVGVDDNGLAWFSVKNETDRDKELTLQGDSGDFSSGYLHVDAGEEVFITAGEADGGESYTLSVLEDGRGPFEPEPEQEVLANASADLNSDFTPAYNLSEDLQRGISLTSKTYDEDGETEEKIGTVIGGSFANSGKITSLNEGIFVRDTDIGASFGNSGDIDARKGTAIDISASTIGGDFINTGNLSAGVLGYQEGDSYRNESEPVPDGTVVFTAQGVDENGDSWFLVRNESNGYHQLELDAESGDFSTKEFGLEPGEEIVVNAGALDGNLLLSGNLETPLSATATEGDFSPVPLYANGIRLTDMTVGGGFLNQGNISANNEGIYLDDVELGGGVENSGDITAVNRGIYITDSTLGGSVINTVDSEITVNPSEQDGFTVGIELDGVEGVGSFVNHGTINTLGDGWGAGMLATGVHMDGVVGNTGTINSDDLGMALFGVDGATGFENHGTINSRGPGLLGIASSIDGDILNGDDGVINSEYQGIFLGGVEDAHNLKNHGIIDVTMGDGITAISSDFEENVVNTGSITAGRGGITLIDLSANHVINSGNITAGTFVPEMDGETPLPPGPPGMFEPHGNGITLVDVDLDGVVSNQAGGVIDAASDGILMLDVTTRGLENLGTVTAGHHGLAAIDSDIIGNVYNNGTIDAGEDAIRIMNTDILKEGGDGSMMTGHIISGPDGVIIAGDDGIRVRNSFVDGNIENYGSIDAGENAIDIDDAFVDGHVLNAGMVTAGTTAIDIGGEDSDGTVYVDGAIVNAGSINAGHSGIRAENVSLNGDVLNVGVIGTDGLPDGMTAGIGLTNVEGVDNLINDGMIVAGQADGEGNVALGMGIRDSEMDGNVENNGIIVSQAYGIAIDNVEGVDSVVNSGGIQTNARGIYIVNSDLSGDIENLEDGQIYSRNSAIYLEDGEAGSVINSGTIGVLEGHGIKVVDADLYGNVRNEGIIEAGHHGISLDNVMVDGGVINTGSILAGFANPEGNGIEIDDSVLNGEVANGVDGEIMANSHGIVVTKTTGLTDVINEGSIEAGLKGIFVTGPETSIHGVVINDGSIAAGHTGIELNNLDGVVTALENNGDISAAAGHGVLAQNITLDGEVANTGDIMAAGHGLLLNNNDGMAHGLSNSGTIEAGAHGMVAINTNVMGDVSNSGTITTQGMAGGMPTAGMGVLGVDGIVHLDSLTNSGTINAGQAGGDGNVALGMAAINAQFNGSVSNSGDISSSSVGIYLENTDGITEVTNSGTVTTGHRGISLISTNVDGELSNSGTVDSLYSGIYAYNSEVGSVSNSGTLSVAEGHGIKLHDTDVYGGIDNSGTIEAGHHGISLDNVMVDGGVVNTGSIMAGLFQPEGNGIEIHNSHLNGEVANGLGGSINAKDHGIVVTQTTGITDVLNAGTIDAGKMGIFVGGPGSSIHGSVINDGSIDAGASGIELVNLGGVVTALENNGDISAAAGHGVLAQNITLDGEVANTGDIMAAGHGLLLNNNDGMAHGLSNSGTIEAGAHGMVAINTNVMGNVSNSGTITTQGMAGGMPTAGMGVLGVDGIVHLDSLTNDGTINAGMAGGDGNVALGMAAINAQFNGSVSNSGDISSSSVGIYLENADGITEVTNSGTVTTGHRGVSLLNTNVDGELSNSGIVDSLYSGIYTYDSEVGSVSNSGTLSAAEGHGIKLHDTDVYGGINNSGTIEAGHHGISLDNVMADGGVVNTGSIMAGLFQPEGNGIEIDNSHLNGEVTNGLGGSINARDHGIVVTRTTGITDVLNSGSIDAGMMGIFVGGPGSSINGSVINDNDGSINAGGSGIELVNLDGVVTGLVNEGDITSTGGHGILAQDITLDGVVENSGDIMAAGHGFLLNNNEGRAHGLSNTGTINAGSGHGMAAIDTHVMGDVSNTGTITSQGMEDGITAGLGVLWHEDGRVRLDSLTNSGTIDVGQAGGVNNVALGMAAINARLNGEVSNSGDITSSSVGIYLESADGITEVTNSGTVNTSHRGISLINTHVDGELSNSGAIDSKLSGIYGFNSRVGSVSNNEDGTLTVAEGHGIKLHKTNVGGSVENSGTLSAGHHGISLDEVNADGSVVNSGSITAGTFQVEGNGIEVDNSTLNGEVANQSGATIDAKIHGVIVTDTDGVTNLVNAGTIKAGAHGMAASGTDLEGVLANSGTITTQGVDGAPFTVAMGLMGTEDGRVFVESITNSGTIEAGKAGGEANNALGIAAQYVDLNGAVTNTADGVIKSSGVGMYLNNVDGVTEVINEGTLDTDHMGLSLISTDVDGELANKGTIDSRYSGMYMLNSVTGTLDNNDSITVEEGHGIKVIGGGVKGDLTNNSNASISAGHHGVSLDRAILEDGNLVNQGTINAGQANAEGNGIEAFGSFINGQVRNEAGATIDAAAGGIVLDNTVAGGVINNGSISAGGTGIDVRADSNEYILGGIVNTGTITAVGGPAIKVAGTSIGQVTNTGTINGGVVSADPGAPATQALRDLSGNPIAFDFRDAGSPVTIVNGTDSAGNTGIINGDIFGGDLAGDLLILSSGQLNGDVYDIEDINITGTITLDNNIFSFNNSSTLTVEETGTLAMGMGNTVRGESDFVHRGSLTADVNINERSYDEAIVDVEGEALLEEGSSFTLSIVDQDIRNIDTTDGGANMVIVRAQEGVTNNGVSVAFGADSQSILVDIAGYDSADSIESGATISVADLGALASAGGADSNASNALAALQGIDSAGLVELIENNPDLYDAIWNGSEASLAALADELVASPENGIAAGQAAQAEAVNTILTRIAELRTGASGISTGDSGTSAGDYIRPDSLWIRAIYSDGEQDATRTSNGDFNSYALRSKGFTIGADKDVSDTLTLGAGVTVATSTANEKGTSQNRANSETDTYLGSLYAGWRDQDYFADASVNIGTGKTDLKGADWEADYDSSQLGISVLAGKSFLFNNNDSLVEPRVGFNYTRLETDDYSYQSNGERISVGSQNLETMELGAGVRFITGIEVGDGLLLPEASVMAWHDFKGDEVKANVEFETGGGSFTYFGPEAVKTRYQAGVGAEYLMDNNFTVSVNYEHNWQSGFKADTWVAKLRYDF